jgi:hypothetical protein
MEGTKVFEIGGTKLEVDLRTIRKVDTFKVGDAVKMLVKEYNEFKAYPGVIVGFDEFKTLPSIHVMYLKYNEVQFKTITPKSDDVEIVPLNSYEHLFQNETIIARLQENVRTKEEELRDAQDKLEAYKQSFGKLAAALPKPDLTGEVLFPDETEVIL